MTPLPQALWGAALASFFALFAAASDLPRGGDTPGRSTQFSRAAAAVVAIVPSDDVLPLCHATAIGAHGLVVTKASAIEDHGTLLAQLPVTGETAAVTRRWIDRENDIAVLQTNFQNLPFIEWIKSDAEMPLGTLVLAVDPDQDLPRLGVIAAASRPIEKGGAALGVWHDTRYRQARILHVVPNSAAERAGLLPGDVILSVGEDEVGSFRQLRDRIFALDPDDTISLLIERSGFRQTIEVRLGYQSDIPDWEDRNQLLSGRTSRRRSGFSEILQHDIPLDPESMGTPLLDLEGNVIGINIARVDRASTFALPAALVRERIAGLLGGAGVDSPSAE
ncbi:PDZ domain-containing protein [soil metagenome]